MINRSIEVHIFLVGQESELLLAEEDLVASSPIPSSELLSQIALRKLGNPYLVYGPPIVLVKKKQQGLPSLRWILLMPAETMKPQMV